MKGQEDEMPIHQVPKPNETAIAPALTPQTPSRSCGGARPDRPHHNARRRRHRRASTAMAAAAAGMACLSSASISALPRTASSASASTSARPVAALRFAQRPRRSVALRAGGTGGVEPDLDEDNVDVHATAGEDMEDMFPYGEADGAHSWHEGEDGTWWEGIKEVFETSGGPVGAQGAISWLFIPGLIAGLYFNVDQDYLFLYTVLFIFAFIGMEMKKPSKPSHFEPEMYNLKK